MAVQKFLSLVNGLIKEAVATVTSAGAANAGNIVALDANGKLDATVMPSGIGAATVVIPASEALTAGAFVNIYDNAGVVTARNANATNNTKPANGFVKSAVASGANATVYLDGANDALTGLTTGSRYYLSTTAGGVTATPPSATGNNLQFIGYATQTTAIQFTQNPGITLA